MWHFNSLEAKTFHEKDKKYATSKLFLTPLCRLERATPCYCLSSIEMHAVARLLAALKTSLRAHPAIIKGWKNSRTKVFHYTLTMILSNSLQTLFFTVIKQ